MGATTLKTTSPLTPLHLDLPGISSNEPQKPVETRAHIPTGMLALTQHAKHIVSGDLH